MRKALTTNFITTEKAFALDYVKIAGRDAPEAMALYRSLKDLGSLKKCHYAITLEPYLPNGLVAKGSQDGSIKILTDVFGDDNVLWLLVTQADWPLLQADTENTKIASFQSNRITGRQSGEINLTILETGKADILNSLKAIEDTVFNGDGTQNAPAQYAIILTEYLFDPSDFTVSLFSKQYLVALQTVQIETSSSDKEPLEVTTTWVQLDSFMRN